MSPKKSSVILIGIALICTQKIFTKDFVNSQNFTRIVPLLKEVGDTLDEVRWAEGELLSTSSTISNPGYYILCSDINGYIVIDSDNVNLNLNNYTVYDTTGTTTIITVNNAHKNIVIRNGTVKGSGETSSASGILLNEEAGFVQIEEVKITNCKRGIHFDGSSSKEIRGCNIRDCLLESNDKGVFLNYAIKNNFENCKALNCQKAGFELTNSDLNLFEQCYALKTTNRYADQTAVGFSSTDGEANVFRECIADGIYKTASNFCYNAIGFLLKDNEIKTKIVDCVINKSVCTGDGTSYGIQLDFSLNSNALDSAINNWDLANNEVLCVDWSPESKFIAIGGKDNKLRILAFTNNTLTEIKDTTPNGQDVNCLAWSPNGNYLALGTNYDTTDPELFVFHFDSSPYDPDEIITYTAYRQIGDHVHSVDWSPNSRFLAVGVDITTADYEIQVWGFDQTNLSDDEVYKIERTADVKSVAFSPDGKYLAAVYSDKLEVFCFNPTTDLTLTSKDLETAYGGTLQSVDWSPLICGSRYYLAVSGTRANTKTTEVFKFENEILTSLETADHGANLNINKWAPNGKFLLVGGVASGGDELRIYSFNPSATAGSRLTSEKTGSHAGDPVHSADWSPSAKYIVSVGCETDNETSIFEVSTVPNRCVIENNEIADTQVGIEGSSSNNLIIRNIGYYNKINFSESVFNRFEDGLNQNPTNIDNISIPPMYYPIFKPDVSGDNGNGGCPHRDDHGDDYWDGCCWCW